MTANYIPIPDPMKITDLDLRAILVPIIENLRMLAGMGPYSNDERRAIRVNSASNLSKLIKLIDGVELDQILTVGEQVTAMSAAIDALAGRSDTLESQVSGVTALTERVDALLVEVDDVESGRIVDIEARLTALDDPTTGTVTDHEARLTALDDPTTGIVPDHEARLIVLEP